MVRLRCISTLLLIAPMSVSAADGALDNSFGSYLPGISKIAFDLGSGNSDSPSSILAQTDGKLVLVGTGNSASGTVIEAVRLTTNGALDTGFGINGRIHYAPPSTIATAAQAALQSDGKIVTIGSVTPSGSSNSDFLTCRFTTAGALDTTFASSGCATIPFDLGLNFDDGMALAIQADGRIVVLGWVAGPTSGSGARFGFARLTAAGALDTTFGFGSTGKQIVTRFADLAGAPTIEYPRAVGIQTDGKIVAVGSTGLVGSNDLDFAFVRLTSTGALDAAFGNGGATRAAFNIGGDLSDTASAIAIQRDGKILAAGSAQYSATDTDYAIVRLNGNGSLDATFGVGGKSRIAFDLGGGNPDFATSIVLQSNGRIVVAGYSYNSTGTADDDISVCRLTSTGTLDNTFGNSGRTTIGLNLGGGNFDRASGLALQGGRIVIGGEAALSPSGNRDFLAIRLTTDLVFTNSFE